MKRVVTWNEKSSGVLETQSIAYFLECFEEIEEQPAQENKAWKRPCTNCRADDRDLAIAGDGGSYCAECWPMAVRGNRSPITG